MTTDRVSQILVVEDNPAELQWLCHCLRDHGFHVIGCESAGEALEHLQKRDFGVAVVDLRLPDLSGTQLLARIRSLDDCVRVIIYTGAASSESVQEALALGAFAYLEKFSDPSELLRHVHRASLELVDRYAESLEQAVAARTEELARSNAELETFASVVAHDLRSPLLTISGYCQLLKEELDGQIPPKPAQYLDYILSGATRMDGLIHDLLEYSRAACSRQPLLPVDMQAVLVQARANLEATIQAQQAHIEVDSLPTVIGDATQLVQLLQNLLDNAIKFRRASTARSPECLPQRRLLAVQRGRQRHRHRGRAFRADFSDLPTAARSRVFGDGNRPGVVQEGRRAAWRPHLAGVHCRPGHHVSVHPGGPRTTAAAGEPRLEAISRCGTAAAVATAGRLAKHP